MSARSRWLWLWALCLGAGVAAGQEPAGSAESAESAEEALWKSVRWQVGPGAAELDRWAILQLPEEHIFADGRDTGRLMEAMGNIVSGNEVGFFAPKSMAWFAVFEFSKEGYIRDDEKSDLDAGAMLEAIRKGTEQSNKIRRKNGFSGLTVEDWETPPRYNETTHNLEWAVRFRDDSGERVVNHNIRVLGRRGVMVVTLVVAPEALSSALAEFRPRMEGFEFKSGEKYAEFKQGDAIAKYGLSALVVGGATAVAVKSGLLKHLFKILAIGGVAVASLFKKLTGRGKA